MVVVMGVVVGMVTHYILGWVDILWRGVSRLHANTIDLISKSV